MHINDFTRCMISRFGTINGNTCNEDFSFEKTGCELLFVWFDGKKSELLTRTMSVKAEYGKYVPNHIDLIKLTIFGGNGITKFTELNVEFLKDTFIYIEAFDFVRRIENSFLVLTNCYERIFTEA